jgi:ribosomal protein S18 acetylase RimI-like enzyme
VAGAGYGGGMSRPSADRATERLAGRDEVLRATVGHPYARLTTGGGNEVVGFRDGGTTVWVTVDHRGPMPCGLGDGDRAAAMLAGLAAGGALDGAPWWHLPRLPGAPPDGLTVAVRDEWDFRWTSVAPPPVDGEAAVVPVDDEAAVVGLLRDAFPDTTTRPGDPRVRGWWGIRRAGRLVAVGADRSRGGVGFLSGLTVARDARGGGLGAALAAAMTRALIRSYGVVALGVLSDNDPARRMYDRLGFHDVLERTSLALDYGA